MAPPDKSPQAMAKAVIRPIVEARMRARRLRWDGSSGGTSPVSNAALLCAKRPSPSEWLYHLLVSQSPLPIGSRLHYRSKRRIYFAKGVSVDFGPAPHSGCQAGSRWA